MSNEKFNPKDRFTIDNLETLKIVTHTFRTQILEALVLQALTVKQVAEKLGLPPSKLYYHINLLEKHGMIKVIEEHIVANIIEKVYRATATEFAITPSLLSFKTDESRETFNSMLLSTLDKTREDVMRSLEMRTQALEHNVERPPRQVVLAQLTTRVSEARAIELEERVQALIKEFEREEAESADQGEDGRIYGLTIAFYPQFSHADAEETNYRQETPLTSLHQHGHGHPGHIHPQPEK